MRTGLSSWLAIALCSAFFYACDSGSSGGSVNAGTCNYVNAFSFDPECKEYSGSAWTVTSAQTNCATGVPPSAPPGTWSENADCALDPNLGTCSVPDPGAMDMEYVLEIGGSDPMNCGTAAGNCAGFLAGTFTPSSLCGG